ncbi:hypothetical protein NSR00_01980 [Aeribacillus sp. FSL K6-8394]|uniref:hypothetical protein n=1 Tax=Aeribacillus sp. FSL K6-8394 TaxID=2954570 RepID=UPI0030F8001A
MESPNERLDLDDILAIIEKLSEEDAKSFLKIIYGNLVNFKYSTEDITKENIINDIETIFSEKIPKLLQIREEQKNKST